MYLCTRKLTLLLIMSLKNNRIIQFDALRVIAALAVVWLHTSAQRFYVCYPSYEWNVRNFNDSLVRWSVPIFVMISGALFLDSKKVTDIKILYTRNIIRIILIFIFWSIIYGAYNGFEGGELIDLIQGPFHFWFLKMLIGLYISVPFLKAIVNNRKLEQYFLCLSLITAFIVQPFFPLIGYISDVARNVVENYYNELEIKITSGYLGYFVLGHYLTNNVIKETAKKVICILGIMSIVTVSVLTSIASSILGKPCLFFYDNINIFTLIEALALFIFFKDMQISPKYHIFIVSASKLSLGIYIIHPLVLSIFYDWGKIHSASLNPLFFVPVFSLLVFVVSILLVFVLTKIPIINKFVM